MSDEAERMSAAIDAAAKAFHDQCREKGMLRWETSSEEWRRGIRAFVTPMVVAAVNAADANGDRPDNLLS